MESGFLHFQALDPQHKASCRYLPVGEPVVTWFSTTKQPPNPTPLLLSGT